MTSTNRMVGAMYLGLLVLGWPYTIVGTPAAASMTKTIEGKTSGTAVSANFDFDHADESTQAFYVHGEGKSKGGDFSYQAVVEVAPDGHSCSVSGGVPNAGMEFTLVSPGARVAVLRDASTGDLLFTKASSATLCADFSSLPSMYDDQTANDITGGTGRFIGASGTITTTGNGAFLAFDASGKRAFGWFQDDTVTTLTIP
jgi:hypothetical protein